MSGILQESRLLAKHSAIYGIGTATNKILALALLPIYTQYLTTHDYGIKELVGLTTDIIGTLASTSIASAFFRFYFEYQEERDRNLVLSSSYLFMGGFGLVLIVLLSCAAPVMADYILDSPSLYTYFLIAFVSMWFQIINGIGYNYQRAKLQSTWFIVLTITKLLLAVCLNIYFIIFLHLGVLGILLSTLISSVILFFVLNVPQLIHTGLGFSPKIIKEMLAFSFPLVWAQIGAFIVHISDRFFIKAFCSISDAGLYSLGYRFGTIPSTFVSEPFNQVWQPRRLEIYKERDSEIMFGRIFTYFLVLISFIGLGVAVLAKDVLMIMSGQHFWSAYRIVPIIIMANTIYACNNHFNIGLIISKKTKYLAYINFTNGIFILLLNFLLIPRYGVLGAAYATLMGFIYKVGLTFYFSNRFFKIHFEFVRIGKVFLAASMIYALTFFIMIQSPFLDFILKAALLLLFPVMLYMLGFFTREEKTLALSRLVPRLKLLSPGS
jgi:O-antigen/teichoic acid export membrane protein